MAKAQSSLSDQIAAARERGKKTMEKTPIAETAWYDADHDVVSVILESGQVASVMRKKLQDLAAVPAAKLKSVEILGPGTAIFFDEAGVTLGVADVVKGVYGTREWMAKILGAMGGQARTEKKVAAAQKNGQNGGRPRKEIISTIMPRFAPYQQIYGTVTAHRTGSVHGRKAASGRKKSGGRKRR
jgi:hypothetical protein